LKSACERQLTAARIMNSFAENTGLLDQRAPRRYLWTDAFAVCNFLELHRRTRDPHHLSLAQRLIDQVHAVLGRHREDDSRSGWISGLSEQEGKRYPTRAGLRIGKRMNERNINSPAGARLEWEQDGQYFHYLTKWMHALRCMAAESGEQIYLEWAIELALAAHRAFVYETGDQFHPGGKRMFWKMSIDLSRPLVKSMGQHDALDGFITCYELHEALQGADHNLDDALKDFWNMRNGNSWASDDPLGIGGLFTDACRLAQLINTGHQHLLPLLENLLEDASTGLTVFQTSGGLQQSTQFRLAFRELGLAIGFHGLKYTRQLAASPSSVFEKSAVSGQLRALADKQPLCDAIESFWLEDIHQKSSSWTEHQDINSVMLATSLAPDRYLLI